MVVEVEISCDAKIVAERREGLQMIVDMRDRRLDGLAVDRHQIALARELTTLDSLAESSQKGFALKHSFITEA